MPIGNRFKDALVELRAEAEEARLARPEGVLMYDLIDVTNHRVIARHESYKALAALHYIQFANVDATIIGEGLNRGWAQFDANALLDILEAIKGRPLGPHCYPYNEVINHVRAEVEKATWLICPFEPNALIRQACLIAPDDAKPRKFNPDGEESIVVKKWTMEPQTKRPRRESAYATGFLNQGHGEGILEEEPQSLPTRPDKPTRAQHAPKPAKEPRAMRSAEEISAGRPAAQSKTGMVWIIADRVRAEHKKAAGKELRNLVISACLAEGVNKGTASVQFGKWKAANGL